MTTYLPDPTVNDVSYEGPAVRELTTAAGMPLGHPVHRARRFKSLKPPGAGGRKTVLCPMNSGFVSTSLPTQISELQAEFHNLLEAGWDLIFFTTPVCRAGTLLAPVQGHPHIGDATTPWDPAGGDYGPRYPDGDGWIVPPGIIPPFYAGTTAPFELPGRFNVAQAVCMAVQWVVFRAASLQIDLDFIDAFGRSAGGWAVGWIAHGPDRAPQTFPLSRGQDTISTRNVIRRAILRAVPTHWKAYKQLSVGTDFKAAFFPKAPSSGADTVNLNYDQPAIDFDATDPDFLDPMSLLVFAQGASVVTENALKRTWLGYSDADNWGAPWDVSHVGTTTTGITLAHSSWGLAAFETAFPAGAWSVLGVAGATIGPHDFVLTDLASQLADQLVFLNAPDLVTGGGGDPDPDPGGGGGQSTITPLQVTEKHAAFLVEVQQVKNPDDPLGAGGSSWHRYADVDVDLWSGGALFVPTPGLEVRLAANTASIGDETTTVLLPEDVLTLALSSGEPQAKTYAVIREVIEIPGSAIARMVLTHVRGEVTKARRNPGGKRGLVELEVVPVKSLLDNPAGFSANPECVWSFGDPLTCGIDLGPLKQTGLLRGALGSTVIIEGVVPASGFVRYFFRGYIERLGVRLTIRDWDPLFSSTFVLSRPPPAKWINRDVVVTPGCRKVIAACREYQNELNFMGAGHGIPAYKPTSDKPE